MNWSNHYYNLGTAIPFVAMGFLLETYSEHRNSNRADQEWKFKFHYKTLGITLIVAEGGAIAIQEKSSGFDGVF